MISDPSRKWKHPVKKRDEMEEEKSRPYRCSPSSAPLGVRSPIYYIYIYACVCAHTLEPIPSGLQCASALGPLFTVAVKELSGKHTMDAAVYTYSREKINARATCTRGRVGNGASTFPYDASRSRVYRAASFQEEKDLEPF